MTALPATQSARCSACFDGRSWHGTPSAWLIMWDKAVGRVGVVLRCLWNCEA